MEEGNSTPAHVLFGGPHVLEDWQDVRTPDILNGVRKELKEGHIEVSLNLLVHVKLFQSILFDKPVVVVEDMRIEMSFDCHRRFRKRLLLQLHCLGGEGELESIGPLVHVSHLGGESLLVFFVTTYEKVRLS